jgi:TolB-like protein/DNA-binding winged helix-turn-helix (wHTH) protein/Tfp pilus assembly protein PilF
MRDAPSRTFEFGPFVFDASERVLYRGAERIPLPPKVADTLFVLLDRHGHVVEKGEIMQLVWPDTFVEEGGLTRNISALRKALGEEADGSRYIETIPKRGYRFVASLKPSHEEATTEVAGAVAAVPRTVPHRTRLLASILAGAVLAATAYLAFFLWQKNRPLLRVDSIAVLPLKNISGDTSQDYFAEGMTEMLATELSKTGLRVIAPSSVRSLRPGISLEYIGRRLDVAAVIQGTVLQSGGRVRVNAQLVEVHTGQMLWADSYQNDLRDVLSLQAQVADAIASRAASQVAGGNRRSGPRTQPVVPASYEAYLRGRFFWSKRNEPSLRKAVDSFNEAIAKDGEYALAYAGLADAWALLASNVYDAVRPEEAMPRAKAAALRALELDGELAEAHTSLAYVLMAYDWNLAGADKEFRQAIRLNPGYATAHQWRAHCLLASGRTGEAIAEMRQAQKLDPLSLPVNVGVGWCLYFGHRYDEAIKQYRATLDLEPNFALAHQTLGMALAQKGDYSGATAEFQKAVELSEGGVSAVASLGYAHALAGSKAGAEAQLARLTELSRQRYVPAIYKAMIYLGLRDGRNFSSCMGKAREERSEYVIYCSFDPCFDAVRADPAFTLPGH